MGEKMKSPKFEIVGKDYQTIIRTSMDGFWVTDLNGHFLEVNDAYCQLIGYSHDELLKKGISDVEAAEEPEETARHIQKVIEKGSDRFETRHRCKDGRIVDIEVSVGYMPEGDGRLFTFLRDITERKKATRILQESEERYRSLVENINLGVTLISPDYKIILTNATIGKWFNKATREFVGKNCFKEFEKRNEICAHCPGKAAMATSRTAEAKAEGVRDDGSRFSVHIYAFPTFDQNGKTTGFIEVVEDITERKQAQEELQKRIADLERFQRVTVDRELRMKELKQRIAELEAKLGAK